MASTDPQLFILLLVAALIIVAIARDLRRSRKLTTRPKDPPLVDQPRAPRLVYDAATAQPVQARTFLDGSAYVIDGDTVVIGKTHIRLHGIDAPELDHPYGVRAKRMLARLCKGHMVRAEILETDRHGRTVGQCFLDDGRDLSAEMVKAGLAIDWAKFSGGAYADLEVPGVRKKLWLADARQKGRMHVWDQFAARQRAKQQE